MLKRYCFCGGPLVEVEIRDQFLNNFLDLCQNCRMLLIQQEPTALELQEFYANNYSLARKDILSKSYFEVMSKRAKSQLNFVLSKVPTLDGARVLDFGCGYGLLLDELRQCGANTYGFDYDPEGMRCLDEKGHIRVRENMFADDCILSWDLVCLSHVLEHLSSPVQILQDIKKRARKIFIEVPVYDYSIREQFLDLEGHLWFFTLKGLEGLMDAANIKIEKVGRYGPSLDGYFNQSAYAKLHHKILRKATGDWFFNQYSRESENGMWIRLIGNGDLT